MTVTQGANSGMQKSLPSGYYRSAEIFAQEKEKIFCREWFCAAREAQIPAPGDVLVLNIAGESVLLARTKEGEIRAHYNVCRHRGSRLLPEPGEELPEDIRLNGGVLGANGIRCPYHLWTYALDGKLLNAPYAKESEGFCKSEFSLYPVGVQLWGGFVFLNLTPEAAAREANPLQASFGEAMERVKRYPLGELRAAKRLVYEVAANWKIVLENYNECYHCGAVHPELCDIVPAFKHQGGAALEWERGIPHKDGAVTFTWTGKTSRAAFPGLDENEKVRHKGELIYPNLMLSLACDHVAAFTIWPKAPNHTTVVCDFLFHPDEMQKSDFAPGDAIDFWDLVNRQDWEICRRVQQGTQSRVHQFGYYAPMEDLSLDIRRYVLDRLK
ncbi:MAG TPA: aromatic ring-hydroxylating dioxygenase subunit alpha [Terriglobales bacterium]|nr:aromatic ring-hydroxylating dioxygenase subunit alpha [Terriglobales bacterium]